MEKFLNRREINKCIVATPARGRVGYNVKHDIVGEEIDCWVPTLEIAGCIVKALRERQKIKLAQHLLAKHMRKTKET